MLVVAAITAQRRLRRGISECPRSSPVPDRPSGCSMPADRHRWSIQHEACHPEVLTCSQLEGQSAAFPVHVETGSENSGILGRVMVRDDDRRDHRMVNKSGGNRSEQQPIEDAVSTRADDEQVGIEARRSECRRGSPGTTSNSTAGWVLEVGRHRPPRRLRVPGGPEPRRSRARATAGRRRLPHSCTPARRSPRGPTKVRERHRSAALACGDPSNPTTTSR